MGIKKIQMIPPGHTDIDHPETDSTMVLMADDSTLEEKMGTKVDKSGGTMEGSLVAQANTSYTTLQVHNMILSTVDAVLTSLGNGDIWIKYV